MTAFRPFNWPTDLPAMAVDVVGRTCSCLMLFHCHVLSLCNGTCAMAVADMGEEPTSCESIMER